jgi:hypothetical protein
MRCYNISSFCVASSCSRLIGRCGGGGGGALPPGACPRGAWPRLVDDSGLSRTDSSTDLVCTICHK